MLRKYSDETDPSDWFYLAGDRLRASELIWNAEGLTPSGIELLQEAAERYLKGYLIAKGWPLRRTHDLEELIAEAIRFDPTFEQFVAFAQELTEDFFAQHYQGQDWSQTGLNYATLLEQTRKLKQHIHLALPTHPPSSYS